MSETYQCGIDQSEVLATTRQEFETSRLNVYFVDASVPGAEALALGLGEGSQVYMLDGSGNGLEQIASTLESLGSPVDAVHIYSHGREGAIQLGGQWYDAAALDAAAATLARIGQSLQTDGDILLYGCNTGQGSLGESFLSRMARLASANVAASDDITGSGGDWSLESSSGVVDSAAQQPNGWQGSLGDANQISGWGVMEGTTGADSITGFLSSDRMYGHGGQDTLVGKEGNDVYIIDGSGTDHTLIVEEANQGIDSVYSQVKSFNLSAGQDTASSGDDTFDADTSSVEYIILEAQQGFVAQNATGNSQNQTIVGNALANNLAGGGGSDLLYGYDGNDYLDSGDGDPGTGEPGTDTELSATMYGGKGDDNYVVRNVNDVVTEYANEGTDHVFSFHDYELGSNLENLTLLGNKASVAIGNALNNELRGNSAANTLEGGAGNDVLHGSQDNELADVLDGGAGNDAYYIYNSQNKDVIRDSAGIDTVHASVDFSLEEHSSLEHLSLLADATMGTGNALNNYITGNATAGSVLDGGAGNDTLEGGRGNDTFHIDSAGDMVIDHGGQNDLYSSVSVDLNRFANASIQHVELAEGDANLNATAKRSVGTVLVGNAGSNVLTGGDKNDVLNSGDDGIDRLVGGAGNDQYEVLHANVTVVENAGDANGTEDLVNAYVDYTLAANVENLTLLGDATSGTGNNLANVIDGSGITKGVVLHGGVNNVGLKGDTLIGSAGNDQIYTYNANDSINFGNGGNDVLYVSYRVAEADDNPDFDWSAYFSARGVVLPDSVTVMYRGNPVTINGPGISLQGSATATYLVGTDRNDTLIADSVASSTLDGGKGGDSMVGGDGSDVFYVDSVGPNGDTVRGNGGLNTIRSSVNIDLNATDKDGIQFFKGVDAVELLGTANLTLKGYAGSDSGMKLTGNSGANQIWGGTGNDTIDGGAGADVMTGGDGADIYLVDNAKDRVVENADAAGADSIYSNGVSINLASANYKNVEFVQNVSSVDFPTTEDSVPTVTAGTTSISMIGTANTETLIAGNAGDTLDGGGGADILVGGTGADNIYYYGTEASVAGNEGRDTLTVRKTFTGNITLEQDGITGIEAVVLEAGAAADVDASKVDAGVLVQGNSGNSSITGGAGNDSLHGGGGQDTILAGAGNDLVEIAANAAGYGQLDGGSGEDTLSFGAAADKVTFTDDAIVQRVGKVDVNVDAENFNVFSGGAGNDTLDASSRDSGIALAGGLGVDSLVGGAGNDTLIADGGNDRIVTGAGSDIVRLTAAAIGSTITVSDFDAGVDSVDDSALRDLGWGEATIVQNGANATLTWTNPNNTREKVTLVLQNTVGADVLFGYSAVVDEDGFNATEGGNNPNIPYDLKTAASNTTITGGNRNDAIVSTGDNNTLVGGLGDDLLEGSHNSTMDGGEGNDTIYVIRANDGASLSVNGGAGDDEIGIDTIGGGNFTLDGGEGDDILYFDSTSVNVTLDSNGQVSKIEMDGATATGTASSIEMLWGSSGADNIDASSVSDGASVVYGTGGGDDSYQGADSAADVVYLHSLDGNSKVDLSGGSGQTQDQLIFDEDQAISMSLGDDGSVATLVADNAIVIAEGHQGSTIRGFDLYSLGDKADSVVASSEAISAIANESGAALGIYAGGGNDTIELGDIDNVNYYVVVHGEDGNDSLSVGGIGDMGNGTARFDGGAGSDTLKLNAAEGKGLYLKFNGDGGISSSEDSASSYYDASDDTVNVTDTITASISGFEHIDGSANAANYFDAIAYNMTGGTLGLYGGEGHDQFYLGNVQAGSVTLSGGVDDTILGNEGGSRPGKGDRFHIGDVGTSASVKIDAGSGDGVKDKLDFDGSKAVNVVLNSNGDISSVSMGGQKVNITGTGLSAYEGTDGDDVIDARKVTSVDSDYGCMTLEGGTATSLNGGHDGNDTIYTGNISGGQFIVEVGSGADSIIGGAGNDYIGLGDNPNDPDGAYINEATGLPYNNDGNDTITTGAGNDTIQVFEQANGSWTTITDFDTSKDTLDDAGLLNDGWSREITTTTGRTGVTVTWFKEDESSEGRKEFHLQFTNQRSTTFLPAIRSIQSNESEVEVTGPVQIYGTTEADSCTINASGAVTLDGNGGDDDISLEGDSSNDTLVVVAGAESISINANGASGNDVISLEGTANSGEYILAGGEGNDQLYLEEVAGANVALEGGDGADTFYLGPVSETGTVVVRGDATEGENSTGDVVQLLGDGASVTMGGEGSPIQLDGIETILGTTAGDSIELASYTGDPLTVNSGDGNDAITAGSNMLVNGGKGDDLLILSGEQQDVTLQGGAGSDTLALAADSSVVSVSLMGSSGTALTLTRNDDATSIVEGVETITAGDGNFDLTLAGNVDFSSSKVNSVLEFGSGSDKLTLTDTGAGSTIRIRNFEWWEDSITGEGWERTNSAVANGNTTQTYTNGSGDTIKVILEGTTMYDNSGTTTSKKETLEGGSYYIGSKGSDVLTLNLGGETPMYVNTFGSNTDDDNQRDSVYINVNGAVDPGLVSIEAPNFTDDSGSIGDQSLSRLIVNADSVSMTFGEISVDKNYDGERETVAALTQIEANGYTANLSAWGFAKYHGTTGADTVNTTGITSWQTSVEYESNGGDDVYIGGAGSDMVYAYNMNANTSMSMNGGGDGQDYTTDSDTLVLEGNAFGVTVDGAGDITAGNLKIGTAVNSHSSFTDFETYLFTEEKQGDSFDASAYVSNGGTQGGLNVFAGGGNDTIVANRTNTDTAMQGLFQAYGEAGNDTFKVGTIEGSGPDTMNGITTCILLSGGTGADTYQLRAEGYGVTIEEYGNTTEADRIELYGVADGFDLDNISFKLESSGYDSNGDGYEDGTFYTLQIRGMDDKTGTESSVLTFQSDNFTNDSLLLYNGETSSSLMASIDLNSVVTALQNSESSTEWQNLTLNEGSGKKYTAS